MDTWIRSSLGSAASVSRLTSRCNDQLLQPSHMPGYVLQPRHQYGRSLRFGWDILQSFLQDENQRA